MTELHEPTRRRLIPLLPAQNDKRHGNRSHLTCLYRCGNACDAAVPNTSDNTYFADVVSAALSRRGILKAGATTALVVGAGQLVGASPAAAEPSSHPQGGAAPGSALTFTPVPPNNLDELVVPPSYDYRVVARWGDPVEAAAEPFDPYAQSPAKQAQQFGYNCDYVTVLPLPGRGRGRVHRALLVVNHEYTDEQLMFPGVESPADTTPEQRLIAMMAHGMSVVEIERIRRSGSWQMSRRRRFNRRITAKTPMRLTGPAAGHALLRTSADPRGRTVLGTLNNCAGGTTPWGTVLSGEENFNQYFGASGAIDPAQSAAYARYGISTKAATPSERRWEEVDPRFDLTKEPNEPNRFGWVVEVDPYDPDFTPRKRTALGRFKHEGATIAVAPDGRVVAYMGDDERFDYIYKFVSSRRMRRGHSAAARRHNLGLLDQGDLYVARFTGDSPQSEIDGTGKLPSDGAFDGRGEWIALVEGGESKVPGMSVAEVLIHTRLAADTVSPTKMDRPEDIERNPVNGRVYAALTNNSRRTGAPGTPTGPDEANPLNRSVVAGGTVASGNRNGHIIEWRERRDDPTARSFAWRIFLIAGDPSAPETYFAGYDKSQVSPISCPDNVAFDPAGNLWIATDGNALGSNDGFFPTPVDGPHRGHVKQFLSVPHGAEACGPWITGDARSVFVAVQHPGETDGSTFDSPSSTWPDKRAVRGYPRPSVAVVFKTSGDPRVGS